MAAKHFENAAALAHGLGKEVEAVLLYKQASDMYTLHSSMDRAAEMLEKAAMWVVLLLLMWLLMWLLLLEVTGVCLKARATDPLPPLPRHPTHPQRAGPQQPQGRHLPVQGGVRDDANPWNSTGPPGDGEEVHPLPGQVGGP
jgi:hypothetical protein